MLRLPPPRGLPLAAGLAGLTAILTAAAPAAALAQTLTTGALSGVVRTGEQPVAGASLTLTELTSGVERVATSDGAGRFSFSLLPTGRYDLLAEQLAYRPGLVTGILVRAGLNLPVTVQLAAEPPPVIRADTARFVAGALDAGAADGSWRSGEDLAQLASPFGLAGSALALSSRVNRGLELEGLPGRSARVAVDGVSRIAASSPHADRDDLAELPFPLDALGGATTGPGRADAEWQAFGGGLLRADPLRGPARFLIRGFADGSSEERRGGLILGGPLVADTAGLLLGFEARRVDRRFDAPWARAASAPGAEPGATAARLDSVARDSFGLDLGGYLAEYTERSDLWTGFGRFDWSVARGSALSLRANASKLEATNPPTGSARAVGLGTRLEASDVSGAAALVTALKPRFMAEFRLGVDYSERDWRRSSLPGNSFADLGVGAGADDALPGRFRRTDVAAMATAHYRTGVHHLKGGISSSWTTHDQTYAAGRAGAYAFGGPDELAARRGSFVQTVGSLPAAEFSTRLAALHLQDVWAPAPGLEVLLGIRVSREFWPRSEVALEEDWLRHTGLANNVVSKPGTRLSPRFAFQWTAGETRAWVVRGDAGLFAEEVDPAVLAEAITHDGPVKVRRGLGALGGWPAVPDSVAAPLSGPALSILHPDFESPRTGRVSLGVSRAVAGLQVHLGGAYRHTDYLPRRRDLNLRGSRARDADGRPVYGTLEQLGSLVAATPGSNRRFADFDQVVAIEPSGYSDYWAVTAGVERVVERGGGLSLWASYTFSRTTDNLPGAPGLSPALQYSPFPDSTGSADWREGRSDLDLPHRAALGAELRLGGPIALRLGLLVRYRSGYPYTPGFRDGVDLNGDGVAGNDPAFISDTLAGAAELVAAHDCLVSRIGRFAERNSCRGPAVASLDARAALRLFSLWGGPVELVVDGVNLLETDQGVIDRAVYLVDRTRAITTGAGGAVRVPLVANPNFGQLLARRSPRAGLRAGLRVNF